MGSLVYFKEGSKTASAAQVREWGLGYLLDGAKGTAARGPSRGGANNADGVLFTRSGGHPRACPHWVPHLVGEGVWIGWEPDDPPGPADLARTRQREGHLVQLADGNEWLVPVARRPVHGSPFARRITFGPSGPMVSEEPSDEAERWLWAEACRYWDAITTAAEDGSDEATVTMGDAIELAAAALALNYRVSKAEVGALGLLSTDSVGPICEALCDVPSLRELLDEHPNAGGLTPSRGPATSSPTTPQPSPICTP